MALKLYFHPFSSYCQKVLIALYENAAPFEPQVVDLGEPAAAAALKALWPIGKFPVLRDEALGLTLPESTVIIEHLAVHYPGPTALIPADPDEALQARLWDRIFDNHVMGPVQKLVGDRLRPLGHSDPYGVGEAHAGLATAYAVVEERMRDREWALGPAFTLADCAAGPSLFYADLVVPIGEAFPAAAAYLARLKARPSFARAIDEAAYFMPFFPKPRLDE
jgi:glutathione S-transferase